MGSTPDGRLANDRIAAKEREIRGELPPHVAEEHVLYRVLEQLAPSLTETEADVLAHRLAHLPAVAVYLGGPEMSLPAIRRFVACWRRRRKGWCRFLNVATSGGEEMKVLAADVLAAGRASLNGTPLPAWIRQVGLQRAVDALWVLVELSGRCMSLEADSKKLDRVELSWSLYSRPCDWSRIELFGGDDRDMKLVWVESDVVKGTCFDLDAPTLLTLPEWLEGLTRRFEIAWEPPRMHPYELTESEQERVLAWLLRNRVSSIKPPES